MESPHLMILDQHLERAERLKHRIINTGIICRIFIAGTLHELNCHLRDHSPAVVITGSDALPPEDAAETVDLLQKHRVSLLFVHEPEHSCFLDAVLQKQPCQVVSSQEDTCLYDVVRSHLERQGKEQLAERSDDSMQDVEVRFLRLFEHTREAVAYIHQGLHVDANPAYLDCFGIESSAELEGLSLLDLMQGIDADLKILLRDMSHDIYPHEPVRVELRSLRGEQTLAELSFLPVRFRQEPCAQVILRKQTAQGQGADPRPRENDSDPLTRMLRRDTFLPRLAQYLADTDRSFNSSALLYLQPVDFEEYQDVMGHAGADMFLADFAATVRSCLDRDDVACRFSDHAIAVLLRRRGANRVEDVAQSIVDAIGRHSVQLEHVSLETRCHIGMVLLTQPMNCADEAIRQARTACRMALEQGLDLVRYQPRFSMVAMDAESEDGWLQRLRFALDHGNFYSLQHGIVHLERDTTDYLETRSYLREENGDLDQREFLRAAEVCQLGAEFDRMIIPGILQAISSRPGDESHILTISANSVLDEAFPSWLSRSLEERGLDPRKILLQISAPSILDHQSRASSLAADLGALGCRLVLSEFDHEPMHFGMISGLGVALVKLSQSLTREMMENEVQKDRVKSLVKTLSAAGVDVMAEGIRSTAQLAALWQAGIKLVGGEFLRETKHAAS